MGRARFVEVVLPDGRTDYIDADEFDENHYDASVLEVIREDCLNE